MILQLYQKLPHYLSILSSALLVLLNQSYNHYLFLRVNMSPHVIQIFSTPRRTWRTSSFAFGEHIIAPPTVHSARALSDTRKVIMCWSLPVR
jgi:hypothetical protein